MEETPPTQKPPRDWPLPSWSKISEFVLNVIQLERSFKSLKAQNEQLTADLAQLQRQVDEQGGQLKVLLGFVQTSLREQMETSAEKAAARFFERLMDLKIDPPDEPR